MRAVHAIWAMDRKAGGTSTAVAGLCDALEASDCPVMLIHGQGRDPQETLRPRQARAIAVRAVRLGRRTLAMPGLMDAARAAAAGADRCVLHAHGLWTPVGLSMARLARSSSWPLAVSPHGMLEPRAFADRRWLKRLALALGQRAVLESAHLLVATSEQEALGIRRAGFRQPIAVIPIGVQLPEHAAQHVDERVHRALFLGRLHPIKGLPLLIEAWSRVRPRGWQCLIAGPSELRHRAALERQIRSSGLAGEFQFLGKLDASLKEATYRSADLFVLPSLSENFGVVVAEALSYGVPVLATRGTPWRRLAECGAGWWVEPSVEGLEQGLRAACSTTAAERARIGTAGRRLAQAELQWPAIAQRMVQCYEWLFERDGPAPDAIML
ncbi:MAG TPA: glycosyltransferase [Steroidobacteraceae bacterium]|nr:glycosyltransferase [Steroidobacteraceae bacterium]